MTNGHSVPRMKQPPILSTIWLSLLSITRVYFSKRASISLTLHDQCILTSTNVCTNMSYIFFLIPKSRISTTSASHVCICRILLQHLLIKLSSKASSATIANNITSAEWGEFFVSLDGHAPNPRWPPPRLASLVLACAVNSAVTVMVSAPSLSTDQIKSV